MSDTLQNKTIILGITGGIAAYKAAEICSTLVKSGAAVHVIMTENATRFIGPATFRALTSRQVITGMWDEPSEYDISHVSLPDKADMFLIAPATANIIGKVASGIADDMLSTTIMATKAPVIFAPAMNCKMWENPIVQGNAKKLESLGYLFIGPESGRLACGTEGAGRLASTSAIIKAVTDCLGRKEDLAGMSIMVTAGPTHEPIDPVRFIGNRSSGKMGYAIASAAAQRGAKVTLVSGPSSLPFPANVEVINVRTAADMYKAVMDHISDVQVVIGAAAPADFTPKVTENNKIKKSDFGLVIELEPTRDIMAELGRHKEGRTLVAFAAETEKLIPYAKAKLQSKNVDLIVANDVSKPGIGFESDENEVTIIGSDGSVQELSSLPKIEVANRILDRVRDLCKRT